MHLYYSKLYDQSNGYAVYYLNGDLKQQVKVTHQLKEKDNFLEPPPNDIIYVGQGRYGWSHRFPNLRKPKV